MCIEKCSRISIHLLSNASETLESNQIVQSRVRKMRYSRKNDPYCYSSHRSPRPRRNGLLPIRNKNQLSDEQRNLRAGSLTLSSEFSENLFGAGGMVSGPLRLTNSNNLSRQACEPFFLSSHPSCLLKQFGISVGCRHRDITMITETKVVPEALSA